MKSKNSIVIFVVLALVVAAGLFLLVKELESEPVERTDSSVATRVEELPEPGPEPEPEPEPETNEKPVDEVVVLDCNDCWLAPVDKLHSLPSTYAPTVIATGVSGGGSMTTESAKALQDLFNDANAEGIDMYARSAYRSYATQETTFEKWVGIEIANGYSREEAEKVANTYSARPGHSEHQLGTTVDLLCTGAGFDSTPCNEEVWSWLIDNTEKHGFVLSYPDGQEEITGYTFEPWHYRYIGVDLAQKFNSQTSQTLNQWLTTIR